jgi:RNA polymerase sigma-70 factor (ECF subfamily)
LFIDKNYTVHLLECIAHHDDRKAFEALFQIYYERLFHFSSNFVHDRNLAEEIVSDVFVKIWRNRQQLINIQNIDTYLFVANKNQSFNYLQKSLEHHAALPPSFDPDQFIEWFNPEKELEYQELLHDMQLAVENLPDQCKLVFKLIREEGFKYKEVAEILQLSVRTVETQLFRAMKKLSIALDAYLAKKQDTKKSKQSLPTPST